MVFQSDNVSTSNARAINHFESAKSRSEVQPFVLRRWFVCRGLTRTADPVDHTRSRRSEQIGRHFTSNESKGVFRRRVGHEKTQTTRKAGNWSEQIISKCMSNSGEFTGAKIRAEYCQSLLPMPGVAVLAGVKGPRVGPGSALGGHGGSQMGHAS